MKCVVLSRWWGSLKTWAWQLARRVCLHNLFARVVRQHTIPSIKFENMNRQLFLKKKCTRIPIWVWDAQDKCGRLKKTVPVNIWTVSNTRWTPLLEVVILVVSRRQTLIFVMWITRYESTKHWIRSANVILLVGWWWYVISVRKSNKWCCRAIDFRVVRFLPPSF